MNNYLTLSFFSFFCSELGVDAPFPYPLRELQSSHRDTLVRLSYFPKISYGPEDVADGSSGRYVAVSRDGVMTFWNMELNLQRTVQLNDGHYNTLKGNRSVWVTDCVVLANVKKIAVSTTERDIAFYDCAANNFEKHFVVSGFQHTVLCMDYWYNPENYNECMLFFGDMDGHVSVLIFSSATTGLFDIHVAKNQGVPIASYCRIMFRELVKGLHPKVRAMQFSLHDDWVKKVKYYPTLQCFISCATTNERLLLLLIIILVVAAAVAAAAAAAVAVARMNFSVFILANARRFYPAEWDACHLMG